MHLGRSSETKGRKNKQKKKIKKNKMTDELMDEATKRGVESRSTRLKTNEQVTWGHNIIADGWAVVYNPIPHTCTNACGWRGVVFEVTNAFGQEQ